MLEFLNHVWGARSRVGRGSLYRTARLHRVAEFLGIDTRTPYKLKNCGSGQIFIEDVIVNSPPFLIGSVEGERFKKR